MLPEKVKTRYLQYSEILLLSKVSFYCQKIIAFDAKLSTFDNLFMQLKLKKKFCSHQFASIGGMN